MGLLLPELLLAPLPGLPVPLLVEVEAVEVALLELARLLLPLLPCLEHRQEKQEMQTHSQSCSRHSQIVRVLSGLWM